MRVSKAKPGCPLKPDVATIAAALATAKQALRGSSANFDLEAQLLLAEVLERPRSQLMAHPENTLTQPQQLHFQELLARRSKGEPLAYVLGWREFYGLRMQINSAVLIPRPETELLVELALEHLPADSPATVIDLGTGSGAIAIAIASLRPATHVIATDLSAAAVQLARDNAAAHAIANISFYSGNWYRALPDELDEADMIISNPPYVAAGDQHLLQGDCRFEPSMALTPGADDLASYRSIVAGAPEHLCAGGLLLLEHGYDQRERLLSLFAASAWQTPQCLSDYCGNSRVIMAQYQHA